ncbi:tripartite motif-containing protein 14 isoform X2 [Pyxicephalus adspersus]|uniref:tripartite motif-containing protein 14 isoform X2 n=1 Tax=Pyxicephalus adspersus TaxID=30357 RepID=UPI003B59CFAA
MDRQDDSHLGYQVPSTEALCRPSIQQLCGLCGSGSPVPVCLVTCGHHFCLDCLEGFWQQLPNCEKPCPTCTLPRDGQASPRQQPLKCSKCPLHQPCIARWSCLTCGESYCPEHFQPHMLEEESGGVALAGHRVCNAMVEEARRMNTGIHWCPEHRDRQVEMYCGVCRVCICTLCPLLGTHKGHQVTLLHQESMLKKKLMNRCLEQLDLKRINVLGNIQNIEQAATELKASTLKTTDSMASKFTELRLVLDEEETLVKKHIDDKAKMVLWAYDGQIETCQNQIRAIDKISTKIRGIHQQPDAIQLIQEFTASEKEIKTSLTPAEKLHPVPVTFEHVENYYGSFIETLQTSFKEPLASRLQKDARCPTLDPDTMHPKLRLSEDLLTVSCAWLGKFNSSHPPRFDKLMQILSRDSYFSGTHYWEVDVLRAGQGWWIGITYPSIQRKGDSELSRLGWTSGSWCIKRYDYEYWAFHKGERKPIYLNNPPEKVGVFLDYESGVLSFFDVTAGMRQLHTFRCRFTEPLYPALRLWDGSVTICRMT